MKFKDSLYLDSKLDKERKDYIDTEIKAALRSAEYYLKVQTLAECIYAAFQIGEKLGVFVDSYLHRMYILNYEFLNIHIVENRYFLIDGKIREVGRSNIKYKFYKSVKNRNDWLACSIFRGGNLTKNINESSFDNELTIWFDTDELHHIEKDFVYCPHCLKKIDKSDLKPKWFSLGDKYGTLVNCPKCKKDIYLQKTTLDISDEVLNNTGKVFTKVKDYFEDWVEIIEEPIITTYTSDNLKKDKKKDDKKQNIGSNRTLNSLLYDTSIPDDTKVNVEIGLLRRIIDSIEDTKRKITETQIIT